MVPRSGTAALEVPVLPLELPGSPVLVLVLSALAVVDVEDVVPVSLAVVGNPPDPKPVASEVGEHAASDRAESAVVMAFMAPRV